MLAGVRRVIARRGVEETRFIDVTAETGAALSTLQYRFGNWESMIVSALRQASAVELERVATAMTEAPDPIDSLRRFVLATTHSTSSAEQAREGWLVWVESWRTAARDPQLAGEWRAIHDNWRALLEPVLTEGAATGEFNLSSGPQAAAIQILALMDGLCVPYVLGHPDVGLTDLGRLALHGTAAILGCTRLADEAPC
jgi:AcrR family transcriptional regulator